MGLLSGSFIAEQMMMSEFKNWETTNQKYQEFKKQNQEKDILANKKIN